MNSLRMAATVAVLLAVAASGAAAADVTVDKIDLGTHVFGERLSPEDLQGRVVVIFFWDLG